MADDDGVAEPRHDCSAVLQCFAGSCIRAGRRHVVDAYCGCAKSGRRRFETDPRAGAGLKKKKGNRFADEARTPYPACFEEFGSAAIIIDVIAVDRVGTKEVRCRRIRRDKLLSRCLHSARNIHRYRRHDEIPARAQARRLRYINHHPSLCKLVEIAVVSQFETLKPILGVLASISTISACLIASAGSDAPRQTPVLPDDSGRVTDLSRAVTADRAAKARLGVHTMGVSELALRHFIFSATSAKTWKAPRPPRALKMLGQIGFLCAAALARLGETNAAGAGQGN